MPLWFITSHRGYLDIPARRWRVRIVLLLEEEFDMFLLNDEGKGEVLDMEG
jgi:hypothetical protein